VRARVTRVVWSVAPADKVQPGAEIIVKNLESCGKEQGWGGPGEYILALANLLDGTFRVTQVPNSPGYPASPLQADRIRIYPATPAALQQLQEIRQQYHPERE